jgi:hypothetical protein
MAANEIQDIQQIPIVCPECNEEKTIGEYTLKIKDIFQKNNLYGHVIIPDSSTNRDRFNGMIYLWAMTPLHRYMGNPILTSILPTLFHINFSDDHRGCPTINPYTPEKLRLKSERMVFASEILSVASQKKMRTEEGSISCYPGLVRFSQMFLSNGSLCRGA